MTLPEVGEFFEYLQHHPPVHELVAAHLGFEPPQSVEDRWENGAMNPAEFFARAQVNGGKLGEL